MQESKCPICGCFTKQVKAGIRNGMQQYQCSSCKRRYVPESIGRGYPASLVKQAETLRRQGYTLKQIGAVLNVTPRTLTNWFRKIDPVSVNNEQTASEADVHISPESKLDATPISEILSKRRVTIHDVAERSGVAASTVSNYLNDKGRMNNATRERIQDAIRDLHFIPNALTRAIRNRRTGILGVVTYGLGDIDQNGGFSILPAILAGVNRNAQLYHYDVLMYTDWFPEQSFGRMRFLDGIIDGLLCVGSSIPEPLMQNMADAGLPIIALLTRQAPSNVGYIDSDNIGSMHRIVEHLLSIGRRRISYFLTIHDSNHIDRYLGFCQAMEAAGLTWDQTVMQYAWRPNEIWDAEKFFAGLNYLLDNAGQFDALVIPGDRWAVWVIEGLRNRGVRVPEDIAVVGFDDVPNASILAGGVTTIRQPFHQMGEVAVQHLMAMIEGASAAECRITLPGELIVRASTVRDESSFPSS